MAASITEGFIDTERLRLFALRSQPTQSHGRVLLLGGSNFDLHLKRQFLDTALAQRFEITTYEPRGIGRSDQPDGDWQMEDYALDALALMDAIGWPSANVIGESFGGMTALHLALMAPDRVGYLAIASAAAGGDGGASFDISAHLGLPAKEAATKALCLQDTANRTLQASDPPAFQARLEERLAFDKAFADPSVTSGGYARLLAARARHDVWERVPDIQHDTTVITGTRDEQAPLQAQRALANRLRHGRHWQYDGGHGVAFTQKAVMEDLCALWCDGLGQHTEKGERHG
ncbi:alpha/beta fold hydrolase [Gymnodinialimonas sp.]